MGTVFPTLVGVFPQKGRDHSRPSCLPHARGGVSDRAPAPGHALLSSPRSWGCFPRVVSDWPLQKVFPTLVGVFPVPYLAEPNRARLPHARGGVSTYHSHATVRRLSSPRSWGCFRVLPHGPAGPEVFPTLVGVFLFLVGHSGDWRRLPHARGGVSCSQATASWLRPSSPRSWGCFHNG